MMLSKDTLKRIAENPYLNGVAALVLLYSGFAETLEELKGLEGFKFGVHHGVIVFALLHLLKTLPDLLEAIEYLERADEEKKE